MESGKIEENGYREEIALSPEKNREPNVCRLAGFWIRALAFMVDGVVVAALTSLVTTPLLKLFGTDTPWPPLTFTFSYIGLVGSAYFIVMTKFWGQTVGKMLFGLRVIRQDGRPLDWLTVLFREGVGRFLAQYVFWLGYVWVAFHPRKKGWHDLVADTYVIYDREEEERLMIQLEASK